ncbi:MAG: alpha-mannosidase, partial [Thermoplasmata archaeon]
MKGKKEGGDRRKYGSNTRSHLINRDSSKLVTLHMIGNAHIDPVWLWTWQEGYQTVKSTFRSILDLMKEFPDITFTCSSAAFYEWIEKCDPEMFREIRQRVEERRWAIVGGWWIEPDCNLPCGESFVRQALYGQRYFKEKFGVMAETGYNIDSFGHNYALPQILSKCRLRNYVFMRPNSKENTNVPENVFWWESVEGSRILCYRIPFSYTTGTGDIEKEVKRDFQAIKAPLNEGMCFYGVGDHGGGPTRENIASILRLKKLENMPNLIFSSPDRFFRKIRRRKLSLKVFRNELQHHASGCYSVQSTVKRKNLEAENLLLTAEKMAILANVLFGKEYPCDGLTRAWKNLLFAQFHDILAGTSTYEAYQGVYAMQEEALNRGNEELNCAVGILASNIKTHGEGSPIIVFNPNSWSLSSPIEVEGVKAEGSLLDNERKVVPIQKIRCSATVRDEWR